MSITDPLPDDLQRQTELSAAPADLIGGNANSPHRSRRQLILDLASAYFLAICRVIAWGGITWMFLRWYPPVYFAIVAMARSTIGLLSTLGLGVGPAMIHLLAKRMHEPVAPLPVDSESPAIATPGKTLASPERGTPIHTNLPPEPPAVLNYRSNKIDPSVYTKGWLRPPTPFQQFFGSGLTIAFLGGIIAMIAGQWYGEHFGQWHGFLYTPQWDGLSLRFLPQTRDLVSLMALGVLLRMFSEPYSALLQVRGHMAWDNLVLAVAELIWMLTLAGHYHAANVIIAAANGFVLASGIVLVGRVLGVIYGGWVGFHLSLSVKHLKPILLYGAGVLVAQLADFFHGPTDQILIGWALNTTLVATYNPALQIDAGLLLLVSGIAATLLPRSALAHARGDVATLRRYYLRGTLTSLILLIIGAVLAWLLAPWVIRWWLHDMGVVAGTLAILPWVLVHTVLGGSSAIGRSILLGMGKVKVFAWVALASGVLNVLISAILVKYTSLGLKGIILGTIITVALRCVIWMPWYVMKCLKKA